MERTCCNLNERIEMSSSFEYYKELISSKEINTTTLAVIVGIVVVIITSVLLRFIGRKSRKSGILLVGCSDGGKTDIFSQLLQGKNVDTQTSLLENVASYQMEDLKNVFKLYDLPGHESIRYQFLEKFKHEARAIIFVIDSGTFQKNHQDVAEFLFRIFTDKSISKSSLSVCIACNKQDLLLAKSKKVIHSQLEKELNTLRKTQSAALTDTDDAKAKKVNLGKDGQDFQFKHLSNYKIEFVECSTRGNEDSPSAKMDELKAWISTLS